jgi:ribosomal protein S18 acetylase RimI-like enzyme
VGEEAVMRIDAYINLGDANKPTQPHFYLNTLAVHPKSQGKGIGSALLEKLHAMSIEHPLSCGVALDTEKEKNVTYYERFGYRISTIADLHAVKIWFMFQSSNPHNLSN